MSQARWARLSQFQRRWREAYWSRTALICSSTAPTRPVWRSGPGERVLSMVGVRHAGVVRLNIDDIPVYAPEHVAPLYSIDVSPQAMSRDEDAEDKLNFDCPQVPIRRDCCHCWLRTRPKLRRGCCRRCTRNLVGLRPPRWPTWLSWRHWQDRKLSRRSSARHPALKQPLRPAVRKCGRTFLVPFDVHRFFFGDLRTDQELLYREVHYLAYHYHWSEREIMEMPRDKRRTYIDVLADEDREVEPWRLKTGRA